MDQLHPTWPDQSREKDKQSANRLLRKLRIAFIVWLMTFIAAMLWITNFNPF